MEMLFGFQKNDVHVILLSSYTKDECMHKAYVKNRHKVLLKEINEISVPFKKKHLSKKPFGNKSLLVVGCTYI